MRLELDVRAPAKFIIDIKSGELETTHTNPY